MRWTLHHPAMQPILWLPISCALILILTGCANKGDTAGNNPQGTGPFDKDGNYIDSLANDPSKWSKPGKRPSSGDDLPVIAKNEEPPPNANPLAPQGAFPKTSTSRVKSTPPPPKQPSETPKTTVTKPTPSVAKTTPKPKPSTTKAKSKPKPSVAKSKSKPKSARYVVKQGDNLWDIARRNGTSVSAIQKANDLSGTLIHPGKSLVVPKR
jgi:LysM repeat protein